MKKSLRGNGKDSVSRLTVWWALLRKWQRVAVICVPILVIGIIAFALMPRVERVDVGLVDVGNAPKVLQTRPLPQIDRQILYSANGVSVIADNIVNDPLQGLGIRFEFENKRPESVSIRANKFVVNGVMAHEGFSIIVRSGQSVSDVAFFDSKVLKLVGFHTITDCEIGFTVTERIDKNTAGETFTIEPVHMYTTQRNTTQYFNPGELVECYNDNGIIVSMRQLTDEETKAYDVLLVVENTTKNPITVSGEKVTAAGIELSLSLFRTVAGKCKSVDAIRIPQNPLLEDGDRVTIPLTLTDSNHYTIAHIDAIA